MHRDALNGTKGCRLQELEIETPIDGNQRSANAQGLCRAAFASCSPAQGEADQGPDAVRGRPSFVCLFYHFAALFYMQVREMVNNNRLWHGLAGARDLKKPTWVVYELLRQIGVR